MGQQHYKFAEKALPYQTNALEPYIDETTMRIHHDRYLKNYVDNLNLALANFPEFQNWSLERLIKNVNWLPSNLQKPVRDNAGGVYNHEFYFAGMTPNEADRIPGGALLDHIRARFQTFENFKALFKRTALLVFGSGYVWLVCEKNGDIKMVQTANEDTPLNADVTPIFCIDVWEHAYFLLHYDDRASYIDDWFNVLNWTQAEKNYSGCTNLK
jgi:Fe-Mn family superoxide dismutase